MQGIWKFALNQQKIHEPFRTHKPAYRTAKLLHR